MPNDETWTPDKPLANKDDEEDCQREAQARARVSFLQKQYDDGGNGGGSRKKRGRLFAGRD